MQNKTKYANIICMNMQTICTKYAKPNMHKHALSKYAFIGMLYANVCIISLNMHQVKYTIMCKFKYEKICTACAQNMHIHAVHPEVYFFCIYMQLYAFICKICKHEMHMQKMQKICTPQFADDSARQLSCFLSTGNLNSPGGLAGASALWATLWGSSPAI